ncbi:MAG: RNA polymerase sigma factor [Phycisphaerae bacterium]
MARDPRDVEPNTGPTADPSRTDRELVAGARHGDQDAFHQLVDRHAGALFGLAMALVGSAADAEDVVQETFAGAYRGLRMFRAESSVKTWLTRILINQAARHRRSRRRHAVVPLEGPAGGLDETPSAGPSQEQADIRMDMSGAMMALAPEHREVIALRELEGMSYDEIAAALGVPRGTVESRLFRARRILQGLLKEYLK